MFPIRLLPSIGRFARSANLILRPMSTLPAMHFKRHFSSSTKCIDSTHGLGAVEKLPKGGMPLPGCQYHEENLKYHNEIKAAERGQPAIGLQ